MVGPIKTWSYSSYSNFVRCPFRVYLEKVMKEPQPPLIIPEGKDEHPMSRGNRIHQSAEDYVSKHINLIPELHRFKDNFEAIRYLQEIPKIDIVVEEDWAYTSDWAVTGWRSKDAWLRMKIDLLLIKASEAILVDHKSGKRYGNEVTHMTQAQLYQLGAFLRYPELEHIIVEFWYVDIGEITQAKFTRNFGMQFIPLFESKGLAITNATDFIPTPSNYACKYCPYSKIEGSGICDASLVK